MEIRQIPLSLVHTSPMNPRKTFDEEEIQELADNIERQGLLQPITVRPVRHPSDEYGDRPDKYEIVCGERRFRAFSKLSEKWSEMDAVAPKGSSYNRFSEISAIVREMTDDEAFDAMITENLQRKDVDPIEESFAFGQLIRKGKTAEEVALRFGKSIRFVQDRVKLNSLIPELMLEVRNGDMPIAAGMMTAKLPEDDQRRFFSQYRNNLDGYSKKNAERFIDNLFLTIDHSLWYQSDNQEDEDFEGGCGRKCTECRFNTSNHGCLFWEMKTQDTGRCSNRAEFFKKTLAFMLKEIDLMADSLVRKGEPLEFGKTVLCIRESYISDSQETKTFVSKLREKISERGYELVDPNIAFQSVCYLNSDDEKTKELLDNGELYRCLDLISWQTPRLNHQYWYVKKEDGGISVDGMPLEVKKLIESLKNAEESLPYSYTSACAAALGECNPSDEPLTEDERVMLLTCMLNNNYSLCKKFGMFTSQSTDPRQVLEFVAGHPEKWAGIMSGWMLQQLGVHANLRSAEPILDDLGKKHCTEEYQKAKDKVLAKFNKSKAATEKKLRELGYGLDGKALSEEDSKKTKRGKK